MGFFCVLDEVCIRLEPHITKKTCFFLPRGRIGLLLISEKMLISGDKEHYEKPS